jgi:hypothetical protein
MIVKVDVLKQVAALPGMSTQNLKKMWKDLFNADPPPYNKQFLVKRLAYRLQELAYGGLTETSEKRLQNLADGENQAIGTPTKRATGNHPIPGTRLLREWKGVEHCVTALADGFEHQGQHFRSLSAVARAITGTRWNGRVFFGLRKQGDKL